MGASRAEIQEGTNKEREGVRESERNKSDQILVVYARARESLSRWEEGRRND